MNIIIIQDRHTISIIDGTHFKIVKLFKTTAWIILRAYLQATLRIFHLFIRKILEFDKESSKALRINKSQKFLWISAAFLAHSGDSWWWLIGLLVIWLLGKFWYLMNPRIIEVCAFLAIAIFGLVIVIFSIKLLVRRSRPKGDWGKVYRNTDPHSFPSGHAARAFLIFIVALAMGPIWLAFLILFWAILVSIARVAMGVHYFSDIVVGMIIGIIWGIAMILIKPYLLIAIPGLSS